MSHTYQDPETGINACFNSDFSGDVLLVVPAENVKEIDDHSENQNRRTVVIPGDFLIRFVGLHFLRIAQGFLEQLDPVATLKRLCS